MTNTDRPTLVERLRKQHIGSFCWLEAADRIEELEREVVALKQWAPQPKNEPNEPSYCWKFDPEWQATLDRIRHALQFGQHVSHADACALFEAVTGERITTGKRCEDCDGDGGRLWWHNGNPRTAKCSTCQGTGYAVRPSWMEDAKCDSQ